MTLERGAYDRRTAGEDADIGENAATASLLLPRAPRTGNREAIQGPSTTQQHPMRQQPRHLRPSAVAATAAATATTTLGAGVSPPAVSTTQCAIDTTTALAAMLSLAAAETRSARGTADPSIVSGVERFVPGTDEDNTIGASVMSPNGTSSTAARGSRFGMQPMSLEASSPDPPARAASRQTTYSDTGMDAAVPPPSPAWRDLPPETATNFMSVSPSSFARTMSPIPRRFSRMSGISNSNDNSNGNGDGNGNSARLEPYHSNSVGNSNDHGSGTSLGDRRASPAMVAAARISARLVPGSGSTIAQSAAARWRGATAAFSSQSPASLISPGASVPRVGDGGSRGHRRGRTGGRASMQGNDDGGNSAVIDRGPGGGGADATGGGTRLRRSGGEELLGRNVRDRSIVSDHLEEGAQSDSSSVVGNVGRGPDAEDAAGAEAVVSDGGSSSDASEAGGDSMEGIEAGFCVRAVAVHTYTGVTIFVRQCKQVLNCVCASLLCYLAFGVGRWLRSRAPAIDRHSSLFCEVRVPVAFQHTTSND